MDVRAIGPDYASKVTEIALKGKAHWGYDDAFMEKCREELTYREKTFETKAVFGAFREGRLVGFFALKEKNPRTGNLDDLFILPEHIGAGIGRALMDRCLEESRKRGWTRLIVDSDPFAEGFYRKMGFRRIGEAPSGSIPGRFLPLMELSL